ncbi:DUF1127 domain-containing protein [Frigidibacter sp. MR17.24]|uniref:DUF1127 domain-containing protein n=1 Tax=Frigidibacter sp. MR17.24 TaxID=3127345 RepID=UPI003012DB48
MFDRTIIHFHNEARAGMFINRNDRTTLIHHGKENVMWMLDLARRRPAPRAGLFVGVIRSLGRARALRRQRRALARLDRHLLADIGLGASEARAEATRRAWDVPPHWRQ